MTFRTRERERGECERGDDGYIQGAAFLYGKFVRFSVCHVHTVGMGGDCLNDISLSGSISSPIDGFLARVLHSDILP